MGNACMADLKAERKRAGLTREELAVKAGVTVGTIYRIETGKSAPLKAVRLALATALGVSIGDIDWTGKNTEE